MDLSPRDSSSAAPLGTGGGCLEQLSPMVRDELAHVEPEDRASQPSLSQGELYHDDATEAVVIVEPVPHDSRPNRPHALAIRPLSSGSAYSGYGQTETA